MTGAQQPVGQAIIQELAGMLSSFLGCWVGDVDGDSAEEVNRV